MGIDRYALKMDARSALRESKTSPFLTALVLVGLLYVIQYLNTRLTGVTISYAALNRAAETGDYSELYRIISMQAPNAAEWAIGVLLNLMGLMLNIGFSISALHVMRREPNTVGNLFDGFGNLVRILWLMFLIWLFTTLWTMLFIIPGFIASYRYRMALFLLLDDPEKRPMDCIRESGAMMAGHKLELFVLDLSFIGWYILTCLPFVSVYVTPYTRCTYVAYYLALRGESAHRGDGYTED